MANVKMHSVLWSMASCIIHYNTISKDHIHSRNMSQRRAACDFSFPRGHGSCSPAHRCLLVGFQALLTPKAIVGFQANEMCVCVAFNLEGFKKSNVISTCMLHLNQCEHAKIQRDSSSSSPEAVAAFKKPRSNSWQDAGWSQQ